MKILITGAAGNVGGAIAKRFAMEIVTVRLADVGPPPKELEGIEYVRCDTRTYSDVYNAVDGVDVVIHLAAWHCAHQPPVSDSTIFAVNVDGTFNVIEACRARKIKGLVFASSMAYGWGSIYSVTKVIGEELCRAFHEISGASVAILRYHAFVPGPYLEYGARLLRNGVDRQDVAAATVAAAKAVAAKKIKLFNTIVHTAHGIPVAIAGNFRVLGPDWCEEQMQGSKSLLKKYGVDLPERVEQHDLSAAGRELDWEPRVNFMSFLKDLKARDLRNENVRTLVVPGELPN